MKLSVITVARNAAATISDTLRSVAEQSHPHVEHIVIDGASTDDTLQIVRGFSHIAQLVSESDSGLYHAMNKGIRMATGEVIGILNADDVYAHADVLTSIANTFEDPDIDVSYGDLVYVERDHPDRVVRYWQSKPFSPGLFRRGWLPAHPTFFVRHSVYEKYGGFDLSYRIQSDFELTMRLLEIHRVPSRYLPEILVRMRMGGATNNSIANMIKGNMESYRACRRHGLAVTPWFFVSKFASRLPQFLRRPAAD